MNRVLFVCTGNTCRSPMAEAILRSKLVEMGRTDIEVRSAGVAAAIGRPASQGAKQALFNRSIPAEGHRSQMFTRELGEWADLILTMTVGHKMLIGDQFPMLMDKVFTLKEFVYENGPADHDISDPFGGSFDIYEASAAEIERAVNKLLEKLDSRD